MKKQKRPCLCCGRGIAIHRGNKRFCGPGCSYELRRLKRQSMTDVDLKGALRASKAKRRAA